MSKLQALNLESVKNENGIIYLSFPFVAGTVAASVAAVPFAGALCCSVAVTALLIYCLISRRSCFAALCLLYFFLGAICWCNAALCPPETAHLRTKPIADALEAILNRIPFAGEHSGAVIKALLTGRRDELPHDTVAAFRRSGASHILALSGLHLGVIYAFLRRLLKPLGNSPLARGAGSFLTIAVCWLYASATGASASIIRAFLFICINEVGRALSGRRHSPLGTLCLALTLQLCARPLLISTAGFQLSYLAMLGITLLYPRLKEWYPDERGGLLLKKVWNSAALSVSCQVFTAPVVWWHFRSFPLFFLITNLIALPLAELVIIGAVASAALEAIAGCPPMLSYICGKAVVVLESSLEIIASLSSSS